MTRSRSPACLQALAALLLALFASSCSFVFVKGPPEDPEPGGEIECTSSLLVPTLDVAFITLSLLAASAETGEAIGANDVLAGTPWLVSALYGSIQATRCRNAREEAARELGSGAPPD
ncbi:MAG: hypothetical protein KDA28_01095 [Phycisphaerales bacterium]|nr:hypothetical protein [Phycisphaerales bacterium]